MKQGPEWYKRRPRAFLDDVQGLGPELIGTFAVIVDIIAARGGEMPRDDRHLAGVLGCSIRKARALTDALIAAGKLAVEGENITAACAVQAVFEAENHRETSAKGGRNKHENELRRNETNGLDPSIREDKRKEKNTPPAPPAGGEAKRGSRLPADWRLPKAWGEWAVTELGLSEDVVRLEADKFADHWRAAVGAKARKADWLATWRNWCRNGLTRLPARAKPDRRNLTIVEDLDQRGFRDLENDKRAAARGGHRGSPAPRDAGDDVSRMLSRPAEEESALPFGDVRDGPDSVLLSPLRAFGSAVA